MTPNAQPAQQIRPHIQRVNRGRGHSYKIDGRDAPGVTTLIGKGLAKPAMPYWAARTVAEYVADADDDTLGTLRSLGRDGMINALKGVPWGQRDAAAVRGTAVHGLAEKLVAGHEVHVPDELVGHVKSAVAFMDDWRISPLLVEVLVASRRWHYCGTADAVVDLPDGRRCLLDYKTSKSGIFPETALQLAAYRYADVFVDQVGNECQMDTLDIDAAYAVHLRADGYDCVPVEAGPKQFNAFLHVAHVAKLVDEMASWVGAAEHWSAAKP
jgi:hypothetical protein